MLYTNIMVIIENFVMSKEINHAYMVSSENRIVQPDLFIAVYFSKCEKTPYSNFYENIILGY